MSKNVAAECISTPIDIQGLDDNTSNGYNRKIVLPKFLRINRNVLGLTDIFNYISHGTTDKMSVEIYLV